MNNPVKYIDPSGHIVENGATGGRATEETLDEILKDLDWRFGGNTDTDNDNIPNHPDPDYPATQMGRAVQDTCLPGNLVECFYSNGVMPSGDYDISIEEFYELLLAIGYDIGNQDPYDNYFIRKFYDTPFFNLIGKVSGTICIDGMYCRDRSEYNYIAQGAWSAAVGESPFEMLLAVAGWKTLEYGHLPSEGTILSAVDGYVFFLETNHDPGRYIQMIVPGGPLWDEAQSEYPKIKEYISERFPN